MLIYVFCYFIIKDPITISTMKLKQEVKYYLPDTLISPVDILDFFPMLKSGLTTPIILWRLGQVLSCEQVDLTNQISFLYDSDLSQRCLIDEEDQISKKFIHIIQNKDKLTRQRKLDIYDIIELERLTDKINPKRTTICFTGLITKHPAVDPLFASILSTSKFYIRKYKDDVRNNLISCYKLCQDGQSKISTQVKGYIITKLLLLRELMILPDVQYKIFSI